MSVLRPPPQFNDPTKQVLIGSNIKSNKWFGTEGLGTLTPLAQVHVPCVCWFWRVWKDGSGGSWPFSNLHWIPCQSLIATLLVVCAVAKVTRQWS